MIYTPLWSCIFLNTIQAHAINNFRSTWHKSKETRFFKKQKQKQKKMPWDVYVSIRMH